MAVTGVSLATVTRTKTMGRVDSWVYDDGNIFAWPSTVVGFSNRFYLELGEDNLANATYDPAVGPAFPNGFGGGGLFDLNNVHHLGFFVSGNDRSNGGGVSDPYFPLDPVTGLPMAIDEFTTLFYGYGGTDFDFGASVNLGRSRNEQTAPDPQKNKQSVGRFGLQGGVTYWMSNDNSMDITLEFNKTSITDEDVSGTIAKDDGFQTIAIRARMFWNYTDEVQFVPFLEFRKDDRGVNWDSDFDGQNEVDKTETTTVDLAMGVNQFPNERVQIVVVGGLRFSSMDSTYQGNKITSNSSDYIPYIKGGIDTELRSWLDLRGGVEKQLIGSDSKAEGTNAPETQGTTTSFQGYLGAGIHLGDWTIDTQVDPNIFFDGPNFISGTTNHLNTRVSLVRPW
jgi:hypothetical protein